MNQNGITIVPRQKYGDRYFAVRFRWVDPELWQRLSDQLPKMTPFASAAETGINCCPGCGTRLDEWIEANSALFDELLEKVID